MIGGERAAIGMGGTTVMEGGKAMTEGVRGGVEIQSGKAVRSAGPGSSNGIGRGKRDNDEVLLLQRREVCFMYLSLLGNYPEVFFNFLLLFFPISHVALET